MSCAIRRRAARDGQSTALLTPVQRNMKRGPPKFAAWDRRRRSLCGRLDRFAVQRRLAKLEAQLSEGVIPARGVLGGTGSGT